MNSDLANVASEHLASANLALANIALASWALAQLVSASLALKHKAFANLTLPICDVAMFCFRESDLKNLA